MLKKIGHFFLIYRSLLGDKRTPFRSKVLPWIALLYLILPLDIIPDVLPILGQLDDVTVIITLLWLAIKAISTPLWNEHAKNTKRRIIDVDPVE